MCTSASCPGRVGPHLPEKNVCAVCFNPGNGTWGPAERGERGAGGCFPKATGSARPAGVCQSRASAPAAADRRWPAPRPPPLCPAPHHRGSDAGRGSAGKVAGCPLQARAWWPPLCPKRPSVSPPPLRSPRPACRTDVRGSPLGALAPRGPSGVPDPWTKGPATTRSHFL